MRATIASAGLARSDGGFGFGAASGFGEASLLRLSAHSGL
jgi:hypothetical protein